MAFPNDGTERDKAYFGESGERPPVVLFADLIAAEGATNGICVPVSPDGFDSLRSRELRYEVTDIGPRVRPYLPGQQLRGSVVAFLGKPEFTIPGRVEVGVVSAAYLDSIVSGAQFWDTKCPGFLNDLYASTQMPERTAELRRVDYGDEALASQDGN